MSIRSSENFSVSAINRTNDNSFSFKNGSSTIRWDFSNMNKFLDCSSLRLMAQIRVLNGDGTTRPQNPETGPAGTLSEIKMNDRCSAQTLVKDVQVLGGNGQTIENPRNFGRLNATRLPSLNSIYDYYSVMNFTHGSYGQTVIQGRADNLDKDVCVPLNVGYFTSNGVVNLASTNGLSIVLTLQSQVATLFGANAGDNGGAEVVLVNPVLQGRFLIPDEEASESGSAPYKSYTSMFSVENSSDETHGLNLGLSSVVSVYENTLPVEQLNNFGFDSFATPTFLNKDGPAGTNYDWKAPVNESAYYKGGVDYPLQSRIDELRLNDATGDPVTSNAYANVSFDAERQFYFMDAIKSYRSTAHILTGPATEGIPDGEAWQNKDRYADWKKNNYGLGVRYDMLNSGSSTADFSSSPFSTRIQNTLDGKSANALYHFFVNNAMVNYGRGQVSVSV